MFKGQIALISLAIFGLFASLGGASDFPKPELVRVASERIFAPPGFDDNDNAQLVVHGNLINTCYKAASPAVEVDQQQRKISITPQSYVYFSSWCLNVTVPFTQTIDLGVLQAGTYQIVEINRQDQEIPRGTLSVAPARSASADDVLYAPIKNVRVEKVGLTAEVIISGVMSNRCMFVQKVKVLNRVQGIIEVLPIAGYRSGMACQGNPRPFEASAPLPEGASGNTLIHVRSLNGQSINDVEELGALVASNINSREK
ncbi:hypothetical protein WDW37_18280 [Bdellovibrionota bacterium FG-1]